MSTHAQYKCAARVVAARLGIAEGEVDRLCHTARHAGWRGELDRLGAVLIAGHAARGTRGPAPRCGVEAAIWRDSPAKQDWIQACVAAAVDRVDARWQSMWCPDAAPASAAELARSIARTESHRWFPGRSRSQESKRRRYVLKACGPLRAKKKGNGGGAA